MGRRAAGGALGVGGIRNQRVDIAIASVLPDKQLVSYINRLGYMEEIRNLREEELDPENPIQVFISGQTSRRVSGIIREYPAYHTFEYPDRPNLLMLGLIATDIPTQPGDSGALLVDESLHPMGMLIGRAGERSFFMHIENMYQEMQLKEYSITT